MVVGRGRCGIVASAAGGVTYVHDDSGNLTNLGASDGRAERDDSTGLEYLRARYHEPEVGRLDADGHGRFGKVRLERETRVELATLCLGSTGWALDRSQIHDPMLPMFGRIREFRMS